jgi:molybdate transport system permease protein
VTQTHRDAARRSAVALAMTRARGSIPFAIPAALLVAFLALPVAVLVDHSLDRGLARLLADPAIAHALELSLLTTAITLGLTILLGTPLAYALARRRFRGARVIETLVDLPIVLPPAVAGLALLLVFGRRGPIGAALDSIGIELSFTTIAVILAQLFVSAPLFVRAARAGLGAVDAEVEDAARVDGAGEAAVFAMVTVPLARAALAAGAVLAWARALGEFGATIMFAGNVEGVTQTLPLAVYGKFQVNLDESIAAGVLLVIAAFAVLAAVRITHWRSALELRRVG